MFLEKAIWRDWRTYYKLFFGALILSVILAILLDGYINGYNVDNIKNPTWTSEAAKNYMNDKGDFTFNFFSYFTVQTNILVILWLFGAGLFPKYEGKSKWLGYNLTLAVTVYISITFIIYNTMLLPVQPPVTAVGWFYNVIQHMVCPIVMVVYFLFFMTKDKTKIEKTNVFWKKQMWKYYFYPIIWGLVNLVRGEFRWQSGKVLPYQYFFLNVHKDMGGIPGYVWFLIAIVAIGILVFGLSSLYNVISYKQVNKIVKNQTKV